MKWHGFWGGGKGTRNLGEAMASKQLPEAMPSQLSVSQPKNVPTTASQEACGSRFHTPSPAGGCRQYRISFICSHFKDP